MYIYDPARNRFPWEIAGTQLGEVQEDGEIACPLAETDEGDIICPVRNDDYSSNVYRVSRDGELVWDDPQRIELLGYPQFIASTPDDGFWLTGNHYYKPSIQNLLIRYDDDGEPVFEDFISFYLTSVI